MFTLYLKPKRFQFALIPTFSRIFYRLKNFFCQIKKQTQFDLTGFTILNIKDKELFKQEVHSLNYPAFTERVKVKPKTNKIYCIVKLLTR